MLPGHQNASSRAPRFPTSWDQASTDSNIALSLVEYTTSEALTMENGYCLMLHEIQSSVECLVAEIFLERQVSRY